MSLLHFLASPHALAVLTITLLACSLARLYFILPRRGRGRSGKRGGGRRRDGKETCSVAVVLGSGGHTTELMQLLSALPPARYTPRTYLISSGDRFSADKARAYEGSLSGSSDASQKEQCEYDIITLPRARAVHQSFMTTPLSLARSFATCFKIIAVDPLLGHGRSKRRKEDERKRVFADLVLMNGPGTCVPVVLAVYILRFLGLPSPRLIYVESFARIRTLSLTGKLLRPLVDRFVVQWATAAGAGLPEGSSVSKESGAGDDARKSARTRLGGDVECVGWLV